MKKETFYFGNHHITIMNANYYFPHEMTAEAKEYFFEKNDLLFSQAFHQLADVSLEFYAYENNFEIQKKVIGKYLTSTPTKVIAKETGISPTSINKLKKDKEELETKKFQTIEKLYQAAVSKKATLNVGNAYIYPDYLFFDKEKQLLRYDDDQMDILCSECEYYVSPFQKSDTSEKYIYTAFTRDKRPVETCEIYLSKAQQNQLITLSMDQTEQRYED